MQVGTSSGLLLFKESNALHRYKLILAEKALNFSKQTRLLKMIAGALAAYELFLSTHHDRQPT